MLLRKPSAWNISDFFKEFPALFSERLGTFNGRVCDVQLTDEVTVRSPPGLDELGRNVEGLLRKAST
jgi:hypothetical protein